MRSRCSWPCAVGVKPTISPISVTMPVNMLSALVNGESIPVECLASMNLVGLRLRDFRQGQCIERIDAARADLFRAAEQPDLVDKVGCDERCRNAAAALDHQPRDAFPGQRMQRGRKIEAGRVAGRYADDLCACGPEAGRCGCFRKL